MIHHLEVGTDSTLLPLLLSLCLSLSLLPTGCQQSSLVLDSDVSSSSLRDV